MFVGPTKICKYVKLAVSLWDNLLKSLLLKTSITMITSITYDTTKKDYLGLEMLSVYNYTLEEKTIYYCLKNA